MSPLYKLFFGLILLQSSLSFSQGKLILNGATVKVVNGAYLTTGDVSLTSSSTLQADSSTLAVGGSINSFSNIILRYGTLEMLGGSTQNIPASSFQNNAVNDLIINNSSTSGVTLGGAVDIYNSLTYAGAGMNLSTNDALTIKSTSTKTAYVGDMTGNTISGQVTVERYIPAHKAWRLLSIPTNNSQSVKQSWQEGATSTTSNPVPGYGIQISSDRSTWAADGFDLYGSGGPAIKTYNPATNAFVGVTATTNGIKNTTGYFVFTRGDRTVSTSSAAATPTVLRTKGPLYTYDQAPITIPANLFVSIGNPYASAIDMTMITKSAGVKDFFYIWDPELGGTFGYGAYQTFSSDDAGDYTVTPGGGSYGPSGSVYNYIESGLAFFVQGGAAGGTLTFQETDKTSLSSGQIGRMAGKVSGKAGGRVAGGGSKKPSLRVNLYGFNTDGSTFMDDGFLLNYDDSYSNAVDDLDAIKSTNSSENLSIKSGSKLLVIERRHTIVKSDTILFNWGNVKVQNYRFEIITSNLSTPGLLGFIQDSYLHTVAPLNMDGSTIVNFNIANIPASYAANRFQIVFNQITTLPVTFNSIKAYKLDKNINIEWNVENERNIQQYETEKSVNGTDFTMLAVTKPTANNGSSATYVIADTKPAIGNNYYRIRSVDMNGSISYSTIVKVNIGDNTPEITVYPNPVTNGTINLQLNNLPEGSYGVRLLNKTGQVMLSKKINHTDGSSSEPIQLDKYIPHGIYQLEVSSPDALPKVIEVIY